MDYWRAHFFDFRGRASRFRYWQSWVLGFFWLVAGTILALPYALLEPHSTLDPRRTLDLFGIVTIAAEAALAGAMMAAILAVYIRRLHDRDKGGWWLIAFFAIPEVITRATDIPNLVPGGILALLLLPALVLMTWGFIELGFLHGSKGANRYGPDPLQEA